MVLSVLTSQSDDVRSVEVISLINGSSQLIQRLLQLLGFVVHGVDEISTAFSRLVEKEVIVEGYENEHAQHTKKHSNN